MALRIQRRGMRRRARRVPGPPLTDDPSAPRALVLLAVVLLALRLAALLLLVELHGLPALGVLVLVLSRRLLALLLIHCPSLLVPARRARGRRSDGATDVPACRVETR